MTQNIYLSGIVTQEILPDRVIYPGGIEGSNRGMDIYEIRLENLRSLADEAGGRPALAKKLDMSYQLLQNYVGKNPTKKIGDKTARKAEEVFDLKRGWMDAQHIMGLTGSELFGAHVNEAMVASAKAYADWPFSFSIEKFQSLPADKQARIDGYVNAMIDENEAAKSAKKTG